MRWLVALVALTLAGGAAAYGNEFCEGYKDGYEEGWCDGSPVCMKPMAPMCPMAGMGETTYRHGYNRGFKDGMRARARQGY